MLESFNHGEFKYTKLSLEEQKSRGILGRLKGIIADTEGATRNGRKYSMSLWERVFNDPIVKEKIDNRCLFGELCHPADREEIDIEKVAVCLAEQPVKGSDGKLYGVFDILSTPNGRILKSLCDYGTTVGISSRGSGDLYTDDDGNEAVDPESYVCECFDVVLVPAVKEARLQYVTESLDKKRYNKTLRQVLSESLNKASDDDRVIMEETLNNLNINLDEGYEKPIDITNVKLEGRFYQPGINWIHFYTDTYDDAAAWYKELTGEDITYSWQITEPVERSHPGEYDDKYYFRLHAPLDVELDPNLEEHRKKAITARAQQEAESETIEEECNNESCVNTNEADNIGGLKELQESLMKLSALEKNNLLLQEKLSVCIAKDEALKEELKKYKTSTIKLSESVKQAKELKKTVADLNDKLTKNEELLKASKSRLVESEKSNRELKAQLKESEIAANDLEKTVNSLTEELSSTKEKLTESMQTVTKYQKAYSSAKEKYIEAKAQAYGLSIEDVKSNLNESYRYKDIDSVCESLLERKRTISKLPFKISENTTIGIRESKNDSALKHRNFDDDDYVSDTLLNLIK